MIKKILVPLDGSSLARRALPFAEELGRRFSVPLHLVYATLPGPTPREKGEIDPSSLVPEGAIREERELASRLLARKVKGWRLPTRCAQHRRE